MVHTGKETSQQHFYILSLTEVNMCLDLEMNKIHINIKAMYTPVSDSGQVKPATLL